jgi:Uracil phosphoribosyltransferase
MILPLSIDAYNLNEVLQYGYVVPGIGDAGDRLYGKKGMRLGEVQR